MTGLPSFPDPQTLRRFLRNAPVQLRQQLHRAYDRLLQRFIHLPEHRSRLLFDLDSTVVTSFGHQEGAEVGYNPRYRGKRSYDLLLCLEAKAACGTSMMVAPEGSGASGKSVRTMRVEDFPLVLLRPTRCIWK